LSKDEITIISVATTTRCQDNVQYYSHHIYHYQSIAEVHCVELSVNLSFSNKLK